VVCIGIKILLSAILIRYFAHMGIALAESIAQITNATVLFYFLPKEIKGQEGWRTMVSFARTFAGCAVMAAVVYLMKGTLYEFFSPVLELALLVVSGCLVYGAIAMFLQAQAMQAMLRIVMGLGAKYLPRSS
jgi:putative peptidoglycan lipid II flippase